MHINANKTVREGLLDSHWDSSGGHTRWSGASPFWSSLFTCHSCTWLLLSDPLSVSQFWTPGQRLCLHIGSSWFENLSWTQEQSLKVESCLFHQSSSVKTNLAGKLETSLLAREARLEAVTEKWVRRKDPDQEEANQHHLGGQGLGKI